MGFSKNIVIGLILVSCFVSCTIPGEDSNEILDGSLREKADNIDLIFGAAVEQSRLSEKAYSDALKAGFNCVVSENNMKFKFLQPNEGEFSFSNSDNLINFAVQNSMKVRGHVLLWHSDYQIPDWVKYKPYSALTGVIEDHISGVMGYFKNKIYAWDVANEIILDDGSGLRNRNRSDGYSVWAENSTDDSVIRAAFVKADEERKKLGDDVKLYLCDYNNETKGYAKADKFYEIVAQWVADGVPIDGVGFQLHLSEENTPDYNNIKAQIDRFQDLDLDVQFTEIDIRIKEPFTTSKLENQANMYAELYQMAKEKNINSYLIWGVTDKYSWIPSFFTGYGSGLLFDDQYNKKQAYFKLLEEFK